MINQTVIQTGPVCHAFSLDGPQAGVVLRNKTLTYCGEHVGMGYADKPFRHVHGKDSKGSLWGLIWPHQYEILEVVPEEVIVPLKPPGWFQQFVAWVKYTW